jgi:hypothetical protein
VIPIAACGAVPGCGLVLGYNQPDGTQICWFHAKEKKCPAHRDWEREFTEFTKDFQANFGKAATKRDNYGLVGSKS